MPSWPPDEAALKAARRFRHKRQGIREAELAEAKSDLGAANAAQLAEANKTVRRPPPPNPPPRNPALRRWPRREGGGGCRRPPDSRRRRGWPAGQGEEGRGQLVLSCWKRRSRPADCRGCRTLGQARGRRGRAQDVRRSRREGQGAHLRARPIPVRPCHGPRPIGAGPEERGRPICEKLGCGRGLAQAPPTTQPRRPRGWAPTSPPAGQAVDRREREPRRIRRRMPPPTPPSSDKAEDRPRRRAQPSSPQGAEERRLRCSPSWPQMRPLFIRRATPGQR